MTQSYGWNLQRREIINNCPAEMTQWRPGGPAGPLEVGQLNKNGQQLIDDNDYDGSDDMISIIAKFIPVFAKRRRVDKFRIDKCNTTINKPLPDSAVLFASTHKGRCGFYPRDAMLSRVLAMALCPMSICLSLTVFCRNG